MASIVSGYENDIFISYRQNDNKYDGWVTTFVHNLTLELEATIKEKVSVYFDINPSVGLLETHNVDKSLEEKLKCLIFIPVISRTYCDENSFAWQNEFRAFNRMAAEDKFGREIRLPGGNFASRILPIRIHELDEEDKMLVENELGGPLRSIDFIYKSQGVNRPLGAAEDHPHDNLNHTYYRDQINKVANSIYEIISSLKYQSALDTGKVTKEPDQQLTESTDKRKSLLKRATGKKYWASLTGLMVLLLVALGLIYPAIKEVIVKKRELNGGRTSIVVMPFHNLSNDSTLNYLRIGCQDGVVTRLSFYPEELNVRSSELVRNFLKSQNIAYFSSMTAFSGSRISKKLDADVFLLGGIYKNGERIRLNVQLINSKTKEIIRPFQAEGHPEKIMYTIDSLAEMVRTYLTLSKLDKKNFQSNPTRPYKLSYLTNSPEAYRYHLLALEAFYSFDYKTSIKLDSMAVAIDSNFVAALVTLCWGNISNGNYEKATEWLLKAYKRKDQMPLAESFRLDCQYASLFQTPVEQIRCLKQLQKIDDNNPSYYLALGYLYVSMSRYSEAVSEFEKAEPIYKRWRSEPTDIFYYPYKIKAYNKTAQNRRVKEILRKAEKQLINNRPGPKTGDEYLKIAVIYSNADDYHKAEGYFKKAIALEPGNPNIYYLYAESLIDNELNVEEGLELIDAALELSPNNGSYLYTKGWGLFRQHQYEEALKYLEEAYEKIPAFEIKVHIDSVKEAIAKQDKNK